VIVLISGLVVFQHDLGTALVLFAILLGMLWVVGVPARLFGIAISVVGVVAFYLAASNPERRTRLTSFIDPFKDFQGDGWQAGHGLLGMSSGGIFGKGLSASQQKWGNLPEAHTDFIFAVIGEELGLVGTLLVLALFGAVAFAAIRLAINTEDPFVRYVSAGVTIWLMSQMIINIGMVLALLPVIGIPLPLVSYGGSALVPSMVALGLLVGFARAEPEAAAALRDRRGERKPKKPGAKPGKPGKKAGSTQGKVSLPGAISAGSARARARSAGSGRSRRG
jgi:cell division protein FtsW